MAGRNPSEAVDAFTEPIARAMGCFARGRLSADVRHPKAGYGVLTFNDDQTFPLGRNGRVQMSMMMQYEIVEHGGDRGPWKVSTTGWIYNLFLDDGSAHEFHWHPISDSHSRDPHIHVDHAKAHTPTGRVLIEDVLDHALELGADCLDPDQWARLASTNRTNFGLGATWGTRKIVTQGEPMRRRDTPAT